MGITFEEVGMKVSEIAELTSSAIVFEPKDFDDFNFSHVSAADLMSEIMLDTKERSIMVTGLINTQVIRTAEMMDIFAIVFVRGKELRPEMIELAEDRGIAVLQTKLSMFEVCGRLYERGMKSGR